MAASYHAGCWHGHREQFWVQYLAKGHFDMWTGGAGNRITNLPIGERPTLPPEPQPLEEDKLDELSTCLADVFLTAQTTFTPGCT